MNVTHSVVLVQNGLPEDKSRKLQMQLMMEKLRSKALQSQYKPLTDSIKNIKLALLEKRINVDPAEKSLVQKSLDLLQQNIKVTTLQTMVERLDSVSRHLGLKFTVGPSGKDIFVSSDMFYLEIILEDNGGVKDVKIHHDGKSEPQSCADLIKSLANCDFADFTSQLEGLASIYQLNADKITKCRAFNALQTLETDLETFAQVHYTYHKDLISLVHKTSLGVVKPRRGGHPMKIIYFVSPYDLLDLENNSMKNLDKDTLDVGYYATVCIEAANSNNVQSASLLGATRSSAGLSTPTFMPFTVQNSITLPAVFVLRLNEPMPICLQLAESIKSEIQMDLEMSVPRSLLKMIIEPSSQPLSVSLPDQQHCYFLTDSNLKGVLIQNIKFTHPSQVTKVIAYLRQQALFNCLIKSCVRPECQQEILNTMVFEIAAYEEMSWQHLVVSFEHPIEESLATAEFNLSDISNLKCQVYTSSTETHGESVLSSPEFASKVLQSFSIPITMRSLIQTWERENQQSLDNDMKNNFSGTGGSTNLGDGPDINQHFADPSNGPDFSSDLDVKLEPLDGAGALDCFPASIIQRDLDQFISEPNFLADMDFNQFPMDVDQEEQKKQSSFRDASLQEDPPDQNSKPSPTKTEELISILDDDDNGKVEDEKPPLDTGQVIIESSSEDSIEKSSSSISGEFDNIPDDIDQSNQLVFDVDDDGRDLNDLNDVKEFIKNQLKSDDKKDVQLDKIHQSPSVSITAVDLSSIPSPQILPQVTVDRRPNIEVIPIPNVPSSITITPISAKTIAEEKLKKSKKDIEGKAEKKRKRKLESETNVPEKVKKHSGSLKMSDSSRSSSPCDYVSNQLPSNTMMMKLASNQKIKQSTSPTLSISSVSLANTKYPVTSPKSNSGKPSLSALKLSVHSPKSESKQKNKEFSKDKEKRNYASSNSSLSQSPKSIKSSSSKKSDVEDPGTTVSTESPNKSQAKCRKLNAVIDRLSKDKTTLNYSIDSDLPKSKDFSIKASDKSLSLNSSSNLKNPESYQVKHSSDGMKITINKTRMKESKQKSSLSSSPKSGQKSSSSSSTNSKKTGYTLSKLTSSTSQTKQSFSLPKTKSNLTVTKIKSSSSKVRSDKSIFARADMRKSSPTAKDEEPLKVINPVDSFIKQLDTSKFQIPKLSARTNTDDKKYNDSSKVDSKPIDLAKKIDTEKKHSQSDYINQKKSTTERLNSLPGITITTVEERIGKSKESILNSLKIDMPLISLHAPKADTTLELSECKDYSQKKEDSTSSISYQQKPIVPVTNYSTTPSVSVHILKSPVPSPLLVSSPHSASPSITDEELIDDSFVRVGK
ncbi:mediator of RNA polymerase II transcription subunit 1 isoform X2 [Daktulosphaira vitifoliae]|uniref:mediator of RNA polymerase II transcription subunit 1 isoform X2 n=1 Tax=Daktulosphaira vitifoliae TaxID=58002 RepID=UPI0021AA5AED|nr:mediator of RNA polymerase II transcription subunit 1 isoform X2 [Daktulosphaira vitifoliae]